MLLRSFIRRFHPTLAPRCECAPFEKYAEFDAIKEAHFNDLIASPQEWVAEEKVNGANFSIHIFNRGADVRFAKRSGFIAETEFFFGYTKLLPEFARQIPHVLSALAKAHGDVESAIVYGELFGGRYVHPEIPQEERFTEFRGQSRRVSPVIGDFFPQYSPDIHFCAYDVKYRRGPQKPWVLLSPAETQAVFRAVPNLLYARALFRGTLKKCMAFDLDRFETLIPHLLGLGDYVVPQNIAEGIVLKSASRGGEALHVTKASILKFKHRAFQEARHKDGAKKGLGVEAERPKYILSMGETVIDPSSVVNAEEQAALDGLLSCVGAEAWAAVCGQQEAQHGKKFAKTIDATRALAESALKTWHSKESSGCALKFTHSMKKYFVMWLSSAAENFVRSVWKSYVKS